jgi:hypothetical protein
MRCILVFLLLAPTALFAQLNCLTKQRDDGNSETACHHENGTLSTIETWDREGRWGHITGFNSAGVQLFHYELRRIAGHASVQLAYHPNGQVKSVHYSTAPDGGIQRYSEDCAFDLYGTLIQCTKDQYPYELILEPSPLPDERSLPRTPEVMICAIPSLSVYEVVNTTRKKLEVHVNAKPHLMVSRKSRVLEIKKEERMTVDSVLMANLFFPFNDIYQVSATTKRKKGSMRIIHEEEIISDTRRVYRAYIVNE